MNVADVIDGHDIFSNSFLVFFDDSLVASARAALGVRTIFVVLEVKCIKEATVCHREREFNLH